VRKLRFPDTAYRSESCTARATSFRAYLSDSNEQSFPDQNVLHRKKENYYF
jgi:hypothetical protein